MPTPDADDIRDAAATSAEAGISSHTADGVSTTAMDPIKQLDVADRVARRTAATRPHMGLRISTIKPGGTG